MRRQGVLLRYCCIDLAAARNSRAVGGETQTAPCGRSRARASNASLVGTNTAARGKQHWLLRCVKRVPCSSSASSSAQQSLPAPLTRANKVRAKRVCQV